MDPQIAAAGIGAVGGVLQTLMLPGAKKQAQLNREAANHSHYLNEQSAQNAHARAMQMNQVVYEQNSYQNLMKQLEESGLNKSLATSNGAGGGGGSATSGAQAAGVSTEPVNLAALGQNKINSMAMSLQMAKVGAEIEVLRADAKQKEADALNKEADTTTKDQSRDVIIENIKQEGWGRWLDNIQKDFEQMPEDEEGTLTIKKYTNKIYGSAQPAETSYSTKQRVADIATATARATNEEASAALSQEKTRLLFAELLIAQQNADANTARAAAEKLAAEYNYGDEANWKWWTNLGVGVGEDILRVVGAGKIGKGLAKQDRSKNNLRKRDR